MSTVTFTLVTLVPAISRSYYHPTGEMQTIGDSEYERKLEVHYTRKAAKGERRDGFLVIAHDGRVLGYIARGSDGAGKMSWGYQKTRAAYGVSAGSSPLFAQADRAAAIKCGEEGQIRSMDEIFFLSGVYYTSGDKTRLECLMRAHLMPAEPAAEKSAE